MASRHQPPRIVHVIYALSTGGLENGLVNLINRTPAGRYEHVIVCITTADDFAARVTADGVRVYQLDKREGHDFGFYWRLWRLFRQLRPDIIHSRNLAALETQLLSITNRGVKRVHGEHGREINDLDGTNRKYLFLRKFMRPLINRYITVSKDLAEWLNTVVGVRSGKIVQIYNGVDHQRFSPDNGQQVQDLPASWLGDSPALVVGAVGRLTPVKDQQSLLAAVAALQDIQPGLYQRVKVLMVGDGPLRDTLAGQADALGIADKVYFAGDRNDIPALLGSMDVFVLPSLGEGISNTLLEAMAAGLPVVATAVGGTTELIEDGVNGRLVPVSDTRALAAALGELLEDEHKRSEYGTRARQRVCLRFDWSLAVEAYLRVYDDLLRPRVNARVTVE